MGSGLCDMLIVGYIGAHTPGRFRLIYCKSFHS
jgi:hypothetical protein